MHRLKGVPPKRQNKDYIDRIIHDGSDYNEDEEIREYRRQSRMNTGMREGDSNEMEKDIEEEKEKKKLSLSPNKRSKFNNRHSIQPHLERFHLNKVNNDMIINNHKYDKWYNFHSIIQKLTWVFIVICALLLITKKFI